MSLVTVIIPCRTVDEQLVQCVQTCLESPVDGLQIIVLPDDDTTCEFDAVRTLHIGKKLPSEKRNVGAKHSNARYLAFIDADAYPIGDWLQTGLKHLGEDETVGIATGPNLTPPEDSLMQKASGDILRSWVGLGPLSIRHNLPEKPKETADLMSCNMFISKELFEKLGGFDTSLLTGEDYKLCQACWAAGKRVVLYPDVCVYHHRRPLFLPHLAQMWRYALDKGRVLRGNITATKLFYLLPSAFVIWLVAYLSTAPYLLAWPLNLACLTALTLYIIIVAAAMRNRNPVRWAAATVGTVLTHIAYGIGFLVGYFRGKQSEVA